MTNINCIFYIIKSNFTLCLNKEIKISRKNLNPQNSQSNHFKIKNPNNYNFVVWSVEGIYGTPLSTQSGFKFGIWNQTMKTAKEVEVIGEPIAH